MRDPAGRPIAANDREEPRQPLRVAAALERLRGAAVRKNVFTNCL